MNTSILYRVMTLFIALATVFNLSAATGERTIKGVVLSSEDGEPLIGAAVSVTESQLKKAGSSLKTLGVVTDLDGNFTITIPEAVEQLECRYVGYNPRTI